MKGFYRLLNLEFVSWIRFLAGLLVGSFSLSLLLLNSASRFSPWTNQPRYEDLFVSSGCTIVFFIAFVLLCLYFLKSVYAGYWGSKSVYSYLTLPVRRDALYWSKLLVFATGMLLLIAVQLLVFRLGYALVDSRYTSGFGMHNGWYLALIRSEFIRILLPLSLSRLLSTLSLLLAIAAGLYYGALCERSRKYYGFFGIAAAAFLIVKVLLYRMNETLYDADPHSLYGSSLLLLAFAAAFVWHGIYLLRRGSIA
ncbi:hypothetical protein [Cohnella sp. AR92]|uniref:hypothetical protein n=1 Tax=Cohnella sp. AR92 TaxID=648716 RepID=UPI000F8F2EB4|nr:hypothetical protein [Cohnella sp. AR92]RUS42832.1 hypothetical protein ELR57_25840 [Cohnella sp. AR92]